MPFDASPKPFRLVSAHDLFAERMAEISRQAKAAGVVNRLPTSREGFADSMSAALQHRLREEDR
jgi:hypothetical protein